LNYFLAYYNKLISQEGVEKLSEDFIRAYRESVFLFGEDSEVYSKLTELKDTLHFLFYYEKQRSINADKDSMSALNKAREEKKDPHSIMESLEQALKAWLNFKEVE